MHNFFTFLAFFSLMIWPVSFLIAFVVVLSQIKGIYREEYIDIKPIYDTNSFEFLLEAEKKKRKNRKLFAIVATISISLSICLSVFCIISI